MRCHCSGWRPLLGAASVVLLVVPAWSEDAASTPDATSTPAFTETVTVLAQPIESTGSSVTTLDRAAIDGAGAATLSGLLADQAGLHTTTNGSRGGMTTAEMRGGDPTYTLVVLDGMPLNDGTGNVGDVYGLGGLDLDELQRIEIVRGPVSSLFGSRALAGVIQLETRASREPGTHAGARLEGGSFSGRDASGWVGRARGRRTARASAGWRRERGRVGDDRYDGFHLNLNAGGLLAGRDLRLTGRYESFDADDYPDGSGGPNVGDGRLQRTENEEANVGLHWALARSARSWHGLALGVYRHSTDLDGPAIGEAIPGSESATHLTRLRLGWAGGFVLRPGWKLNAGADAEHERASSQVTLLLGPGVQLPGAYEATRTLAGAFAGLAGNAGSLSWDGTLRVDRPDTFALRWSPRASVSLTPRPWWRVRGSVGSGFKLPSFYALASPRALGGNPDLRPETSVGGDLGLDLMRGGLSGALSVFLTRYGDMIDFDYETLQLVNRARVRSRGVEASVRWQIARAWSLDGRLTRLGSRDLDVEQPILHQPAWSGAAALVWKPRPTIRTRLGVTGASWSYDQQIPAPERDRVAGRLLLDASLAWRVTRRLRLEAHGENLTDREYETLIGFPGPGRSLRIALRVGQD